MSVNPLTEQFLEVLSLKRGCTGSSESTLVKMLTCWQFHATVYVTIASYRSYFVYSMCPKFISNKGVFLKIEVRILRIKVEL